MSLDKAIKYGKERRVQYRRSLAFDRSCRNHGNCGYCESNRTIQAQREKGRLHGQEDEYYGWHNEMVAGNLTNGELVTVEAWNKLVDQQDERRSDWSECNLTH